MSDWKTGVLSDIANITMGQSPKGYTCNDVGNGIPLLNGPTEFGIRHPYPVQFTTDGNRFSKPDDILFCVRGSTTGRMNWADQEYAIGRGLASIRHKKGSDYKHFLKGLLDYHLPLLLAVATGSTFPNVSKVQLHGLEINIPPLKEQRAIAAVLASLDDKIDLLHRQNKTLETLAQTLFRHWFIDNAESDWAEYRVKDFVEHLKNTVKPKTRPEELFHHYSMPSFDDGKKPLEEMGAEIRSNKYEVVPFSIMVSKLNPRIPRVWDVYYEPAPNSVCSTEFQVFKPIKKSYFGFVYYLLSSSDVTAELEMMASGTSGSHQRVKPKDILNIPFWLPNKEKMVEFSKLVEPGLAKKVLNQNQIDTLSRLRDTLLPKLMSGEVRVRQS